MVWYDMYVLRSTFLDPSNFRLAHETSGREVAAVTACGRPDPRARRFTACLVVLTELRQLECLDLGTHATSKSSRFGSHTQK